MKVYRGETDCSPAEIGYDAERLDAVDRFFTRMIEDKIIFGVSYRLARRRKVFAARSIGSRHYDNSELPMMPDTLFALASQSKLFAAVAAMMLAEDGYISVDDKVVKFLPQFSGIPFNEITIAHLLTHTSGLYPHDMCIPNEPHLSVYEHIDAQFEKDGMNTDWIAAGLRSGLRRKPGAEWQYCTFGLSIVGAILEKVTGMKYKEFVTEKIIKPLGMTSTTFAPSRDDMEKGVIFNEWQAKQLAEKPEKSEKEIFWESIPIGSVYSSTEDMIKLGIMLQNWGRAGNIRILGRKTVELMATHRLHNVPDYCWGANEPDRKYGLGVDMRRFAGALTSPGTYFHEGAGHSVLIVDPKEEMVCSCVYPWVKEWDEDCNGRLYNVMWSGLM